MQMTRCSLECIFYHLPPLNNQNYNEIFDNFTLTVSLIINKHAPLASLSRRQTEMGSIEMLVSAIRIGRYFCID